MAALISYVPLYRPAGFSSIPLLRHQHINPVRRSDLPAHPQDQSVVLQFPKGPLAGLCTVPQRHGQLCEGKSVGFSFGHGKGAACLPRLGGWCLIFRFWLDKVVCTPSSRQRNNLHFTHENPSCIPYGAGCYAASRRSWTSIGVRTPRPRWRRWKL